MLPFKAGQPLLQFLAARYEMVEGTLKPSRTAFPEQTGVSAQGIR